MVDGPCPTAREDGNSQGDNPAKEGLANRAKFSHFTTKQKEWMLVALSIASGIDHSPDGKIADDTIIYACDILDVWGEDRTGLKRTPQVASMRRVWKALFNPTRTIAKPKPTGRKKKEISPDIVKALRALEDEKKNATLTNIQKKLEESGIKVAIETIRRRKSIIPL